MYKQAYGAWNEIVSYVFIYVYVVCMYSLLKLSLHSPINLDRELLSVHFHMI